MGMKKTSKRTRTEQAQTSKEQILSDHQEY
jgi:hypothetical protein